MIAIRGAEPADLDALYAIALKTGDRGEDASRLHADPKLIGHIYAAPYAILEPSLALVAAYGSEVAGYAVGTTNTSVWEERLEREWWPALRAQYHDPGLLSDRLHADGRRIHAIHHPQRTPTSIAASFPAHLHLNLLPEARGQGLGLRLLRAWFDRLVASEAAARPPLGVHVGVDPDNARGLRFWARGGFGSVLALPSLVWMGQTLARAAAR